MRETQVLERAIDGVVRHREPELLVQSHDQIAGPPSHDTVDRRDRSFLHDPSQKLPVRGVEFGRHARRGNVNETIRSLVVEPDHPVPQRLPIHPANLGRLGARGSIKHRRDRQQPARLRSILRQPRKPTNLASRVVSPHRNSSAHGNPLGCHLESRRR
jgi:hypothetical protein